MSRRIVLLAVLLFPLLVAAAPHGQLDDATLVTTTAPQPPGDELGQGLELLNQGLVTRNWWVAAAGAVLAAVFLARRVGSRYFPALGTARGGAVLSLVGGLAASLGAAMLAGKPLTVDLVLQLVFAALSVSLGASGAWSVGKSLAGKRSRKVRVSAVQTIVEDTQPHQ